MLSDAHDLRAPCSLLASHQRIRSAFDTNRDKAGEALTQVQETRSRTERSLYLLRLVLLFPLFRGKHMFPVVSVSVGVCTPSYSF